MSQSTETKSRQPLPARNGVDVNRLLETIRSIQGQPELAKFRFRTRNNWFNGAHNLAQIDDFYGAGQSHHRSEPFEVAADEPPVLLGADQAPNPVEILLAALSGCMTTTLAYHAAARGIEVRAIESSYEGDIDMHGFLGLDPQVRKGFSEIRVKFRVDADADQQQIKALLAQSPVFDSLSQPVRIVVDVEKTNGDSAAATAESEVAARV